MMNSNENNHSSQHPDFGVELWHEHVEPKKLYEDLLEGVFDFVIVNEYEQVATILWLLHTYFIKPPQTPQLCIHSAILNINSPVRACGKSTLREILEQLTPRPISMSNGSVATIFRLLSKSQPTLFIDEADTFLENRAELIGILNEGYKQSGKVYRQGGKQFEETIEFQTWGAKCIVGIGNLPDTLKSRCIPIQLKRKLPHELVYKVNERLSTDENYFLNLKRKIAKFTVDNETEITQITISPNTKVDDRTQDNWLPLLKIAKFIGEDIFKTAENASIFLTSNDESDEDIGVILLRDLQNIFTSTNSEKIPTTSIVRFLKENRELIWDNYPKGGLTPYQLSKILKPFHIHPRQFKEGEKPIRGYLKSDFEDAFSRYLS